MKQQKEDGTSGRQLKRRGCILTVSLCIFGILMFRIGQAGRKQEAFVKDRMEGKRVEEPAGRKISGEISESAGKVETAKADQSSGKTKLLVNESGGEADPDRVSESGGEAGPIKVDESGGEADPDRVSESGGEADPDRVSESGGETELDRVNESGGEAKRARVGESAGEEHPAEKQDSRETGNSGMTGVLETTDRKAGMVQPGLADEPEIPGTSVSEAEKRRKLLLVNKSHPVSEDYEVEMATVEDGYLVAKQIRGGLERMLSDGRRAVPEGGFMIVSAYRSRELQAELLQDEIRKNRWQGMSERTAEWDALRTVAPAGCSEHETGLAVDIVSENDTELRESQENTEENRWLRENCWKYGFILRYPKEKEDVTGFAYEPWHFRYVGTYAAEQIMRNGLTLEEYLDGLGRNE